ncbi:hypothetical protein MMC12_008235 [Toensbergia leucococca]|nr:hypothetical protein [Toensbergia leucococca]
MLAIQSKSGPKDVCTPNILPCRIHHDGPVAASSRHWAPEISEDGKNTAYFRGRKLLGREVKIPKGYKGVVVTETDRFVKEDGLDIDRRRTVDEDDEDDEEDDEEDEPVKVLEETAVFQEIFVWGHEAVPEADHPFVRGIEEWIAFADAIHSTSPVKSNDPTVEDRKGSTSSV